VERVAAIVGRQLVDLAVESELRVADAVAVAADEGAEEGGRLHVSRQVVHPEDDVRILAVAVRGGERNHGAAVGNDPCLHAVGVGERVKLHLGAVGHFAVSLFFHVVFHVGCFLFRASLRQAGECQCPHEGERGPAIVAHHPYGKRLQAPAAMGFSASPPAEVDDDGHHQENQVDALQRTVGVHQPGIHQGGERQEEEAEEGMMRSW
jgi:hypothetical protein